MCDRTVEKMRSNVISLINEQRQVLFQQLLDTPDLLKSQKQDQQQRNLNCEDIEQWLEILKGEAYKAERLEVTFAVVGTMKAGKSTTINAIVGTEVLPNRNQPMTSLPTVIRHSPGKKEPELTFSNPKPFNEIIEKLRADLTDKQRTDRLENSAFYTTDDGKELVNKILDGSLAEIRQSYKGTEQIYEFLKRINDIWRLCSHDNIDIDIDKYLGEYTELHEFPAIEVEFFHLRDQDAEQSRGKFTLIDTPGPNEAGQTCLKQIMQEQLEQASAVLAVLDYTQLNAEADADVRKALEEIGGLTDNRLFVLVNKFDQKDRHGMDVEELRSYAVKNLFDGRLPKERIYPVSSKYGYLANRALCELSLFGKLPDYRTSPWVEDFGRLALGACWESEIDDVEEVTYRANKLWKNSMFDKPLTEVIKKGSENAALISLKSAIAKMLDYDKKIVEGLHVRRKAINTDIKVIEEHISSIEQDIASISEAKIDARIKIDESTGALENKIADLFARCEDVAKREVLAIFSEQSNNWITRRLHGFIDLAPDKKSVINVDPRGYNDFETEDEAKQFLNKMIEAVANHIEPVLEEMQHSTQRTVDKTSEGIWGGVISRLDTVLKVAGERLNESFSLTPDFPKPEIRPVAVNFARLRQSAVKEDVVTKTVTRQERRWYTLWCHKHEAVYKYQDQVYRIYTMEIANQLQDLLAEDHRQIRSVLDKYVQGEFSTAINMHFTEIANYLERFRGDLLDSKRDQEMVGDRLENLYDAMTTLLDVAVNHRANVQQAENELLGSKNAGTESPLPGIMQLSQESIAV